MAVTDKEESAWRIDRKINSDSFADLVIVHISAEAPQKAGTILPAAMRRDSYAAEHGGKRHLIVLQLFRRLLKQSESGFAIQYPIGLVAFHWLALLEVIWS